MFSANTQDDRGSGGLHRRLYKGCFGRAQSRFFLHPNPLSFSALSFRVQSSSPQTSIHTPSVYSRSYPNPPVTMKFTATILALAATAVALPQIGHGGDHKGPQGDGVGNANGASGNGAGNGIGNQGNSQTRFRAPEDMTVQQASKKCGDNMQLSCCNKETAAGDTTDIPDGPLADALKGVLGGAGSGSEGLGLLEQCGKLDIIPISKSPSDIDVKTLSNNIQSATSSTSTAMPRLLAARTAAPAPTTPSSASTCLALPSPPSSKRCGAGIPRERWPPTNRRKRGLLYLVEQMGFLLTVRVILPLCRVAARSKKTVI